MKGREGRGGKGKGGEGYRMALAARDRRDEALRRQRNLDVVVAAVHGSCGFANAWARYGSHRAIPHQQASKQRDIPTPQVYNRSQSPFCDDVTTEVELAPQLISLMNSRLVVAAFLR